MGKASGHPYDAIVLAGGRARRAGGHKLDLRRDGRTLLDHAIEAVSGAATLVLVGPVTELATDREVIWRREDPPYGGPVAAITAALADLCSDATVVLAGDVPYAAEVVPALLADLRGDAAVAVDDTGALQPLLAAYRTQWLRDRVRTATPAARSLLDGARIATVTTATSGDVDTAEDAARLGFSVDG